MTAARDELADLRRRAYAPDGALDRDELDRLQELEDALRDTGDEPADDEPGGGEPPEEPDASSAVPDEPPPPREPVHRTIRRPRVLIAVVVVAIAAAIVASVWFLTRPDGGLILRHVAVNDRVAEASLSSSLRNYGLDPDSYVQFESFERLSVWTARIPDRGLRCLLIVDEQTASVTNNGVVDYSCTPEGLAPSVDIVQYATGAGAELGDRPVGSVVRFVLRGDRVEATVADARDQETPRPTST